MHEKTFRIMIVDDEKDLRETLSTILEVDEYDVTGFDSAEAALSILDNQQSIGRARQPDLLITDVVMPRMSGVEFVKMLRVKKVMIPVLVITACGTKEVAVEMLRMGVLDFIEKPFSARQFSDRVAGIVAKIRNNPPAVNPVQDPRVARALHDFNNWLGAIVGLADLISIPDQSLSSEQQLDTIQEKAGLIARAAEMSILTIRKINRSDETPCVVDVHRLLREVLDIQLANLPASIVVTTFFEAPSPCISGNETDLNNAFMNLLVNAAQAIALAGTITVSTSNSESGDHRDLVVAVTDSGCGMTDEVRGHLFESGFSTKQGSNHGLGLHGVMKTIKSCNGTIAVDSTPGKGTTFRVTLPVAIDSVSNGSAYNDKVLKAGGSDV